jgi:O-antigen/teichoic acid export membrane protein
MTDDEDSITRKLFKSGGIVFAGLIFELGLSFLAKLLIANLIAKFTFGIATIGITVLSFGSTVFLFGLNTGVGRYLPRFDDPDTRSDVVSAAVQTVLLSAVLFGAVLFAFAEPIAVRVLRTPAAAGVLRVAAVGIPFAAILKLAVGVVQGEERSLPKVALRNVTEPSVRFLLVAVALLVGGSAVSIMWAYSLAAVAAGVLGGYYVLRRFPVKLTGVESGMRRELLSFSAPLVLVTAMILVLSYIDIFLLTALGDPTEVATYSVVYSIAELQTVVLTSFGFLFMPVISRLHSAERDGQMRRTYQMVTRWILVPTLPVFLVVLLLPDPTIRFTFGAKYTDGALALAILVFGFFTHAILGPNKNTLVSVGSTRLIMYDNVAAALANVALNVALIPRFGIVGAAVATAVSYALLNALYSYQLYRVTGITPFTRSMLRPGALGVGLGLLVLAVTRSSVEMTLPVFVATVGLFSVLYLVGFVLFGGVTREELVLLHSIEERFDVDLGPISSVIEWRANR